ncbi:MAG: hypothetical protein NZ772_05320 [Cyanobacteria bacterium]|nr:hypothetical protein [Cyanobacteriota bacterium]MDW8200906.1 hypothetical protein [Cyanobacteriota bacterium SKYGB_h_bin112]
MRRSVNQRVATFWGLLGALVVLWIMRGFNLLGFMPSSIIWLLLIATIGLAIYNMLHYTRY